MLAAKQEIEKLVLIVDKDDINIEDVINAVADSSRFDVFDMIESAFLGDYDRTLVMLHGLKNEGTEPMALFGALMFVYLRIIGRTDPAISTSIWHNSTGMGSKETTNECSFKTSFE